MKGFNYFGVELAATPLIQLGRGSFVRSTFAIDAIAGDGVEGVGD